MRRFLLMFALIVLTLGIAACNRSAQTGATNEPPATQPSGQQPTQPAVPAGDLPDPTVIEDGKTIEDHVKAYFDAYKEGRLEDAFNMQPAENKVKQPVDQFVPLRKSMPITEYKIHPTKKSGKQATIDVEYDLGQNGTWISSWTFEKQGEKWVALRYLASMKQ